MDSQVEEIKNRLNILDVIGGYIKLTKTGINHRGVCPFHKEKTPSFFVSATRQMWHCFGCGTGGDAYAFVMKIEGVEFGDALRILAAKAGVELKRENVQVRTERARLYEVCNLACLFFEKQLEGGVGKEAEAYLLKRGIAKDSLKKWRVGYSPDTWNGLSDFLVGKGYQREEIVKAGLAIKKEGGGGDSYDRFRGRIIFPVFDISGQVVGFGGRVFKQQGETAKYINTPQTLLYDKSRILYGLHNAKLAVRKQNQCVVTEGYTDVIMCHQAGFENTVAASGTALTGPHLEILRRYTENLVLAFDMDVAGDSATKRGINLAESQGFNIKIIEHYGKGDKKYDPADIILQDPKIWEESLAKAKSIMDYYVDSALAAFPKDTPEGKKQISAVVLPAIRRLPNKIEQSYWIQKLSELLGVKEEAIAEELVKIKHGDTNLSESKFTNGASTIEKVGVASEGQRKKLIEEKIIALVIKNQDCLKLIEPLYKELFSSEYKEILDGLGREMNSEVQNQVAKLAMKGETEFQEDGEEELKLCLRQLKNIALKGKLNEISQEIKRAELSGDHSKAQELIGQFNVLTKELP